MNPNDAIVIQRSLLACDWSLFAAFSINSYSVPIIIYFVLISLFLLIFALFTFNLPTSLSYIL